jgi:hypothetical protein
VIFIKKIKKKHMDKIYREGAMGALLDEYEKALFDYLEVLSSVSQQDH